jgi:hypothetical protein
MQMEMFCSNEKCPSHTVKSGGRFVLRGGRWLCQRCDTMRFEGEPGKNLWDFDTMHIGSDPNQGPIQVTSLRHLRQLEKQHGVYSVAANMDSSRW